MAPALPLTPRMRRPLPELAKEERQQIDAPALEAIGALWLDKARSELGASTAFAEVHRCLVLLGAPHNLLISSARAIDDELRHAELCLWVASEYAGAPLPRPRAAAVSTNARFHGCSESESALLYVALHCGLNEGIACGYLKACHDTAKTELVRAATRELLRDEVKHSRLFWQLVASRSNADRALLGEALPTLLARIYATWTEESEIHARCPSGHGTLPTTEIEAVTRAALETLILPGFREAGIDVSRAEAWLSLPPEGV